MQGGHWKTIDEADGWDTFHDTQVWVDENGRQTNQTRRVYNSYFARKPGETDSEAEERKNRQRGIFW